MPVQTLRMTMQPSQTEGCYDIHITTPEGGEATLTLHHTQMIGEFHAVVRAPSNKPAKRTPKQTRRASIKQEDRIAKTLGGRRQTGSGSVPGIKGDVRLPGIYRAEAKFTQGQTYRLDRKELSKIRGECTGLEVPLFIVDFLDPRTGGSPDSWVTLPLHHFKRMRYEPPYGTSHDRGPA